MNKKTVTRLARMALVAAMMATALSLVPEAAQPVEASPNYYNISCEETVYGRITNSDYYDFWYFSGVAGDKVTITMMVTSGNLDSMVFLWVKKDLNPDYELLTSAGSAGGGNGAVISNFTLPKTGTYAIGSERVNIMEGNTTGSYKLTLTCASSNSGGNSNNSNSSSGSSSSCPQRGGSIVWEGELPKAENHNRVSTNDGDFWAFRANSGDRVYLWLDTSNFSPDLGLWYWDNSNWVAIAGAVEWVPPTPGPGERGPMWKPTAYFIDQTLYRSGCYYVWVHASSNSAGKTGTYTLKFSLK